MPIATNRERLSPGPTPPGPPWRKLTTRELVDWLGVTLQSLYNWNVRRSGPPRTMDRSRRTHYRLIDVVSWLEGPTSPTADQRCRAYLRTHLRLATCATALLPGGAGGGIRRALARLDELSGAELSAVTDALERVKCPWPKAKGGQP